MNISFNRHHIFIFLFCSLMVVASCSRSENRDPLYRSEDQREEVVRQRHEGLGADLEAFGPPPDLSEPQDNSQTPNADKAFKPALSLRTDRLFDFPVFDEKRRFQRLEDEVQKISDNLNEIIPVIQTQLQNKEKLENVLEKLNTLALRAEKQGLKIRGPPELSEDQASEKPPEIPPDKASDLIKIYGMRIAEYPEKLRIVFDSSESPNFETQIEGDDLFLTLKMSELQTEVSKTVFKNSYLSQNPVFGELDSSSPEISFMLKQTIKEIESFIIKPNDDSSHYRAVFDVFIEK